MPLHADSLSRRTFLTRGVGTLAGLAVLKSGWVSAQESNPHLMALLSDTHIPNAPDVVARDTNMTANLQHVVRELVALNPKPAGVLINGDCAYLKGLPEDYANLAACVAPLSDAGLPLHMTMGNHDDREPFYDALKTQKPERALVDSRHVSILETPHANWFLLDSLTEVNVVTGEIGEQQRAWLAQALASRPDKPALVMAHHTPQFEAPAEGKPWGGLRDTEEFMRLLASQSHVKAFIFGHSHNWSISRQGELTLINLPPVAYTFAPGKPNGWVAAEVIANGLNLTLHTIDPAHPQQGERVELRWNEAA